MNQNPPETHSTLQSIVLHLLPGILTGLFYFLIRQPILNLGYPSILALTIAAAVVIVPVELGYLLFQGKKKTGRLTLSGVISYRSPIPWWQYLLWGVVVFLVTGVIFTLLRPVTSFLQARVFFWVPVAEAGLTGNYSREALTVTYALFTVFIVFLAPVVEELYFRGYLLPRMQGKFADLLHSFLFAAYHVFSPWMLFTRTVGLLPLIYVVKKKNIYVGMAVHVLLNALDLVTAIVFIASMTA